jgi:hypothetical protein
VAGLPAALWLLGLFAAAPALRTRGTYAFVDRLRDALILGVAIPFALAVAHALYAPVCWAALVLCIGVAYLREPPVTSAPKNSGAVPPYLLIGALVAVAWPPLMRPLLDGDSLSYHLPNAASWVQAHSIWTTATRYWWYPPASELFAAALYATSGPFSLPWSGFAALVLLGFRIAAWARTMWAAPPLLADALAAATVTAYPLAIQAGTLQNDVWLAAFFLESLWSLRAAHGAATRTLAVTALIKPQGWIFAAIALATSKSRPALWLSTGGVLVLWLARNAILWSHAIVAPASTEYGGFFASTILAHGWPALAILARVAFIASPFASIALLAALTAPFFVWRQRGVAWAACAAGLLFFVLPFGYASSVAQLATGASLRFAAPAIAAGTVVLASLVRRIAAIATALLAASTLLGVGYVLAIFWNDAPTRVAPAVALVAVATVWLARTLRQAWPIAAATIAIATAANFLAGSHPVDFYADALRVNARATGFFSWIERNRPSALGGVGLSLGAVNVLSPQTRTIELPDTASCAAARTHHVILAAIAESARTSQFNAARLRAARACGTRRYDDGIAVVTSPARAR